jgi:Fe-Mn family superoxide dismutase
VQDTGYYKAMASTTTAAATTIQGSGWAILGWDTLGSRLLVHQLYDQQANLPAGQIPLVMLDMWEHAFYLQYKNVKPDYVKAWWNVVNWADAQATFDAARSTTGLITP